MQQKENKLVFLGVGQVARALAQQTDDSFQLYGTTRSAEYGEEIRALGVTPIVIDSLFDNSALRLIEPVVEGASVLVSFPPHHASDVGASHMLRNAASIVYISSTSVYGKTEGVIDEKTAVHRESPQAQERLEAEDRWLSAGASVIRAPGIYGRASGLHLRLIRNEYRLPGDGTNYVSRIHVDDLSQMILSTLMKSAKSQVYLAGDLKPTTHREIVQWLVNKLQLQFPESIPLDQCHYTQRGNRRINASQSLSDLSVTLEYPTYVEGYAEILERLK